MVIAKPRRRVVIGVCVALACLAACGRQPGGDERTAVDLLALFPFTPAGQTVDHIDPGSAQANAHLRAGWSGTSTLPDGRPGVWSIARRAVVQLGIARPANGRLVVTCGLLGPKAPALSIVTVTLNGRRVGVLRVTRELAERVLPLPAGMQREGPNVLEFMNPWLSDMPRNQERQLARAVAFSGIRLEGVNPPAARPILLADGGAPRAMLLPAAARVDFFLRLPDDAVLSFEVAPQAGPASPNVRAGFATEGGAGSVLWEQSGRRASVRVGLDAPAGTLARLSFEARGSGAVEVIAPRVLGTSGDAPAPAAAAHDGVPRPSVLLYLVDTLRADHLGCYGYAPPTSPRIDAFARESRRFSHMQAQSAWTKPGTASIMTGLDPPAHGVVTLTARLRPGIPTLADILQAHGYRTAAFVTNINVRGEIGFRAGFDTYRYFPERESRPTLHLPAAELNEHVFGWLGDAPAEPFFLYVHASDPHAPYQPSEAMHAPFRPAGEPPPGAASPKALRDLLHREGERTPETVAWVRSLYDGDVATTDEAFGALLGRLRALGLYDRMLIVLVADHGEEFFEHGGFEHGRTLFQEQLRVPLIIRHPGGSPRGEVTGLARQIDVLPTVLRAAGVAIPSGLAGVSLEPGRDAPTESFADTHLGSANVTALITPEGKVIHSLRRAEHLFQVYDLERDPAEQHDLAAERPILIGYARQLLAKRAVSASRPAHGQGEEPLDQETARRLRALGYVDH